MKKNFILLSVISTAALGYFSFDWLSRPKTVEINQLTSEANSDVSLAFEPFFEVKNANTATKLGITINLSGEYRAKTARLEIDYSSNCLTPTLTAGENFPRLVGPVSLGNNTIKAAFSAGSVPVTGSGIIAYITTGPKSSGDCQLSFNPNTKILDSINKDILTSATPATIKLKTSDPNLPSFKQPIYKPDTLAR